MYHEILCAASIMVASIAAQAPERADIRGDLVTSISGEGGFGTVRNPDGSLGAVVVSLGVCSDKGAILFTRRSGTPLGVGRYQISEGASGGDEMMALVLAGPPTHPTAVFRGQSGWLVVTAASDRFITGRFQIGAIGFLAAEPQREDRHVNVSGSFSATAATAPGSPPCKVLGRS